MNLMTNQKPVIDTYTKKSKKSKCYIKVVTEAQGREKRRRKEQKKRATKTNKNTPNENRFRCRERISVCQKEVGWESQIGKGTRIKRYKFVVTK